MKLCKIRIRKTRDAQDTSCHFSYPDDYDSKVIRPFIYENRGKQWEHCLAEVPDDFVFTNQMVEISPEDAKVLVYDWVDNDKDIVSEVDKDNMKLSKEKYCK